MDIIHITLIFDGKTCSMEAKSGEENKSGMKMENRDGFTEVKRKTETRIFRPTC